MSMLERARQVGGDLEAAATPAGGRVVARIPLDA
jgi:signal transduction histidine kinase